MHSPISGPPFSAVEATHSTHNHHRGGRHNHLPTRIMPACADLELCKAPDNPPLGERDGHGCGAGCGGRLHGMCGEQEEGEPRCTALQPSPRQEAEGFRRLLESTQASISPASFLQQGASKKKACYASASRKRLTLAPKHEVLKLLDQKASPCGCTTQEQQ